MDWRSNKYVGLQVYSLTSNPMGRRGYRTAPSFRNLESHLSHPLKIIIIIIIITLNFFGKNAENLPKLWFYYNLSLNYKILQNTHLNFQNHAIYPLFNRNIDKKMIIFNTNINNF